MLHILSFIAFVMIAIWCEALGSSSSVNLTGIGIIVEIALIGSIILWQLNRKK